MIMGHEKSFSIIVSIAVSIILFFNLIPVYADDMLLGSTNQGELVEIDLNTGMVTFIGDAGIFESNEIKWADLALDSNNNLFAIDNARSNPDRHIRLYDIDRNTGTINERIGNTGISWISDIDFTADEILFANHWNFLGILGTIDPINALTNLIGPFGNNPNTVNRNIENGGISVHPITGDIWAVESDFSSAPSIFKVDHVTGLAVNPVVRLGFNGVPTDFGLTALEILPDGRFIGTVGERVGFESELVEVNPNADVVTGLAEITKISLSVDPEIIGHLNGLTYFPFLLVDIDIKPGSDPNCFNSDGHGVIPVAVLGSDTFDATQVDPTTLILDSQTVKTKGNGDAQTSIDDVNGDSFDDLVIKIIDTDGTYSEGTGTAYLTGELFDGTPIEGSDSICITQ
jgi:hypothetical protein